jgi:hypothetical protein
MTEDAKTRTKPTRPAGPLVDLQRGCPVSLLVVPDLASSPSALFDSAASILASGAKDNLNFSEVAHPIKRLAGRLPSPLARSPTPDASMVHRFAHQIWRVAP